MSTGRFVRFFIFAALLLLSAVARAEPGAKDTPSAEPASHTPRVLIIGDSISIGYTKQVAKLLEDKAQVSRIPQNGEWTGTGVKKIDDWLGETHWDVIHFNFGLWDMYGWRYKDEDRSPKAYEERLEKIVTRLEKTGAKLIWATTTPACPEPEVTMRRQFKTEVVFTPEEEQAYLDAAARVMKKHKVQVNDLHARVKPDLDDLLVAPDNVHYTAKGYALLAEQVAGVIAEALAPEHADAEAAGQPKQE